MEQDLNPGLRDFKTSTLRYHPDLGISVTQWFKPLSAFFPLFPSCLILHTTNSGTEGQILQWTEVCMVPGKISSQRASFLLD